MKLGAVMHYLREIQKHQKYINHMTHLFRGNPVPHPDVFWYRLNGIGGQKILILFPHIFYVKPKLNIVYEYLKTKTFSREANILPQMHWTLNIFGPTATNIEGFWVSLNYWMLNFKKTVCLKNVWMRHWNIFFGKFVRNEQILLYGELQELYFSNFLLFLIESWKVLEIWIISNKIYGVMIYVHDVTNKILLCDSNYVIKVFMRPNLLTLAILWEKVS